MAKLPPIRAIIFDMDGTLTVPILDFDLIKAEIGIIGGTPVLEAIDAMPPEQRRRANEILARHEADAARACQLSPGAEHLLDHLAGRKTPIALLTRNSRISVDAFCEMFDVEFDAVHTREDGTNKPDPEPVHRLCKLLGVPPAETLVVGDYLFDIQAGRAAGCPTCLIHQGKRPSYADQADLVVTSLSELIDRIG